MLSDVLSPVVYLVSRHLFATSHPFPVGSLTGVLHTLRWLTHAFRHTFDLDVSRILGVGPHPTLDSKALPARPLSRFYPATDM
jgi:hypothetical protein